MFGALFAGFFSIIISSVVLLYVSIGTNVGPWISPVLILIAQYIDQFFPVLLFQRKLNVVIFQLIGNLAGLVATAVGFTFPTFYFLDRDLFYQCIRINYYWAFISFGGCIALALFIGLFCGLWTRDQFIDDPGLTFPVSQFFLQVLAAPLSSNSHFQGLPLGMMLGGILSFFRDGLRYGKNIILNPLISRGFTFLPNVFGSELFFGVMPMMWSIGFLVGRSIIVPMLIGMGVKQWVNMVVIPLYQVLVTDFIPKGQFFMAFCSGFAVAELLVGMKKIPEKLMPFFKKWISMAQVIQDSKAVFFNIVSQGNWFFLLLGLLFFALFTVLKFPFGAQILLLVLSILASYEAVYLSGKIGLIQFGRFTTYVMVPVLVLFKLTADQIAFLILFASVLLAAHAAITMQYKVCSAHGMSSKKIEELHFQAAIPIAFIVTALILFISFYGSFGSEHLFAQRSQTRALLIGSLSFRSYILFIGVAHGLIFSLLGFNTPMILGALLMPGNLAIAFVLGGILSLFFKDPEQYFAFPSGVFVGETMWLIFSLILKLI